jgi:UDP-N-acetylglucosamine 2-epimerase (non-hydrolysing)
MKILSIVGARPEFIQVAPLAWALESTGQKHVIVHTGQHYDETMSDVFFADLMIPDPDVHLGVGSASHGVQTGQILAALDEVLVAQRPDWVVVFGDTNTTLAGALAAVKLHLPVAHVEAGLRSFNRRMPEEHNRVLADHAADLLLAPTELALRQLKREGLADRSVMVGDIKTEITYAIRDAVAGMEPPLPDGVRSDEDYIVSTMHRAENTDDPLRLFAIIDGLKALPYPVVLVAHPRLVKRCSEFGISLTEGALRTAAPLPYPEMISVLLHSCGVVTDSGGLQKEAFLLRVPCTTVRTETEWVETVELGWNVLATELSQLSDLVTRPRPGDTDAAPYGVGDTSHRIVLELERRLAIRRGELQEERQAVRVEARRLSSPMHSAIATRDVHDSARMH